MRDRFEVGELFSGIGGFGIAASTFGGVVKWASDIEPYALSVYARHFPEVRQVGNIREWMPNPEIDRVDLITGGFPCQPASQAGSRLGVEDSRWLWPEYARVIETLRPRYVLAENVSGLRTVNDGAAFESVLASLDKIGYDVEWESIPASAVGALHGRDRLWIVAYPRVLGQMADGQLDLFGGAPADKPAGFVFDNLEDHLRSFKESRGAQFWQLEPKDTPRIAAPDPTVRHRLRCLGNAIVPAVAEFVISRILDFDARLGELPSATAAA